MCIFCNTKDPEGAEAATVFLAEYALARQRMQASAAALLEVKKHVSPEQARRYDRAHKRMKTIMRDWNMIEHQREQEGADKPEAAKEGAA